MALNCEVVEMAIKVAWRDGLTERDTDSQRQTHSIMLLLCYTCLNIITVACYWNWNKHETLTHTQIHNKNEPGKINSAEFQPKARTNIHHTVVIVVLHLTQYQLETPHHPAHLRRRRLPNQTTIQQIQFPSIRQFWRASFQSQWWSLKMAHESRSL